MSPDPLYVLAPSALVCPPYFFHPGDATGADQEIVDSLFRSESRLFGTHHYTAVKVARMRGLGARKKWAEYSINYFSEVFLKFKTVNVGNFYKSSMLLS